MGYRKKAKERRRREAEHPRSANPEAERVCAELEERVAVWYREMGITERPNLGIGAHNAGEPGVFDSYYAYGGATIRGIQFRFTTSGRRTVGLRHDPGQDRSGLLRRSRNARGSGRAIDASRPYGHQSSRMAVNGMDYRRKAEERRRREADRPQPDRPRARTECAQLREKIEAWFEEMEILERPYPPIAASLVFEDTFGREEYNSYSVTCRVVIRGITFDFNNGTGGASWVWATIPLKRGETYLGAADTPSRLGRLFSQPTGRAPACAVGADTNPGTPMRGNNSPWRALDQRYPSVREPADHQVVLVRPTACARWSGPRLTRLCRAGCVASMGKSAVDSSTRGLASPS